MIEKRFDIPFIADLALREKQIQQNYRPIIAVHKWFARRPGTLFRGLLLSEFVDRPLRDVFYEANNLSDCHVADPFMGGGTPIIEANRIGCDVTGFDINPMSYWVVKQEIEHLSLDEYTKAAKALRLTLEKEIGQFYRTRCLLCGADDAHVKYFLWVKVIPCRECGKNIDLFPGYLLSADSRHPKNVFVCHACGELTETVDRKEPGRCNHCGIKLAIDGPAKRNSCKCSACGADNRYPDAHLGAPRHRLFAMEYHCPKCKATHDGRFFKKPDEYDLVRVSEAEAHWSGMVRKKYVPDDAIPSGDETDRLHVFVCRKTGVMQRKWLADTPSELSRIVEEDLSCLRSGNVKPTRGDIRCVTYGHLIRLAIWSLRHNWDKNKKTTSRIVEVADWLRHFGGWADVEQCMAQPEKVMSNDTSLLSVHENNAKYGEGYADVPF